MLQITSHMAKEYIALKICANYFISYLVYLVSGHRYEHLAPRLVTCGLENSTSPR